MNSRAVIYDPLHRQSRCTCVKCEHCRTKYDYLKRKVFKEKPVRHAHILSNNDCMTEAEGCDLTNIPYPKGLYNDNRKCGEVTEYLRQPLNYHTPSFVYGVWQKNYNAIK